MRVSIFTRLGSWWHNLGANLLIALFFFVGWPAPAVGAFVNFESAPLHPVALSPDGGRLAVCNLPDGRVEFLDVSSGVPVPVGSVPVGVDPVSLRFRTANELWVVNYISRTINIVDVARRPSPSRGRCRHLGWPGRRRFRRLATARVCFVRKGEHGAGL